jgi:hypothetical protein
MTDLHDPQPEFLELDRMADDGCPNAGDEPRPQ